MGFVITDITSQNDSDDDVIEVVRDEVPIQIISDDEDSAPQNVTVIQNYHFMPPLETGERKDPPEPMTKDPLDNLSQSTDSECVPSPHTEDTLLSEPPPPGTEDTNDTPSPSVETNGNDNVNSVVTAPQKLPLLLPGLETDFKDINNEDTVEQPQRSVVATDVNDAKV